MKIFKNFIGLAALALCLGFASCGSDDDAPSYSNAAVSNSELMTILKGKGYQFDEMAKCSLTTKQPALLHSTFQAQRLIPPH